MAGLTSAIWQLRDALKPKAKAEPKKSAATVSRVEPDGTVWVRLAGGAADTPITKPTVADVAVGDAVTVEIGGGASRIVGNSTTPAIGYAQLVEGTAPIAQEAQDAASTAQSAMGASEIAARAAEEAQEVAEAVSQHFFDDTDGIHVTEADKETWDASHTGKNILINSLGILIRTALVNLVSITSSAIAFFDGNGNDAENVIAQFGADGATIGKSDESHLDLDYHSMKLVDDEGTAYLHISDLREWEEIGGDSVFVATISEQWYSHGDTDVFEVGHDVSYEVSAVDGGDPSNTATRNGREYTFASVPAAGSSVVITYKTADADVKAYTMGIRRPDRPIGSYSTAEGYYTTAGGSYSHAEGHYTVANGEYAHAEGSTSYAVGYGSHAEGLGSHANGEGSHAEGAATVADGNESHAAGHGTRAAKRAQTAIGTYNVEDAATSTTHPSGNSEYGEHAIVLGNGTLPTSRSNALTVDWSGNVECGTVNGVDVTDVYIKSEVDALIPSNLVVEQKTSSTYTISANTVLSSMPTVNVAKTGYKPLGIVGINSSNVNVNVLRANISGTTAYMKLHNPTSSSISTTVTLFVLYVKNS